MALYKMDGETVFESGPGDHKVVEVTTTPSDILDENPRRVMLGFRISHLIAVHRVQIAFDEDAGNPLDAAGSPGFLLAARAEISTIVPAHVSAAAPGTEERPSYRIPRELQDGGAWFVFGPGGDFPGCPIGRVSARTGIGATAVGIIELQRHNF